MGTVTLTSVEEYLNTSYSPDREYVDGVVLERYVGERDHSKLQRNLTLYLGALQKKLGIHVWPEQRVQVSPTHFRVPDLCVTVGPEPQEQIFTTPPFIVIEILSKDDRMSEMQERIDDYRAFGVPYIWLLNPKTRRAYVCKHGGMFEPPDGVLRTSDPEIVIPVAKLFEE